MNFEYSDRQRQLGERVRGFMTEHVYPAVPAYFAELQQQRWQQPAVLQTLKQTAREAGLWNLFLPPSPEHDTDEFRGAGYSNLEYALAAEEMGRLTWASEVFNCSAPDTGNMEVLHRYGTQAQQERWLRPLMRGEIRSAYAMTEPDSACSDATNVQTRIERQGDEYVINGRKWWISGVGDPRCKLLIVMGKTNPESPRHAQQSQILVPIDTPGIHIGRMMTNFGYDDAPHGHFEVTFDNVRVPAENLVLGEGRGFEISQGRLGPGRIHHCMRIVGLAEVALEKMTRRLLERRTFGKVIADHSIWEQRVAQARIDIEMTRLLTLKAADMMDKVGNKVARLEISMIKVAAPRTALRIIDHAIQSFGAGGLDSDAGTAALFARVRALRIADGPDEVHARTIAKLEYAKYAAKAAA
ncbi:acyl-CoA dehydrogenase (plasmid) [Cupriavidus necator N-1]|uniref:Acyl-CoA dehydrogenase n=1 Tax=Cupriavidus necator (strain ATCC 43291 / DSM 13513 / CCUG 52238 / LMG 8453 / N-1) TaxID=1042878 RepID=F8GWW4_CUPNN|nr:acyl-CoA dehydrogenase family protein [Cupriavidus necator]AEI81834.1 acyl-CoA dehydrogenase [Cupriavidus necator N-1]MDX6008162.1 acyl-CoA dehydrogenase family protein [Cupriavidus necator]